MDNRKIAVSLIALLGIGAVLYFETDDDNPATAAPVQAPAAATMHQVDALLESGSQIVHRHERGVFFDRRPLDREIRRIAENSGPAGAPFERVGIQDASGFEQPMTAVTIEVPKGWVQRGGIEWDRTVECVGNTVAARWSASSPDGLHEVTLLPMLSWQVESAPGGIVPMNPCPAAPMASIRQYLEYVVRNARPGARVISWRERPDLVAQYQTALQQSAQQAPMANQRYEAGELLIGYTLQGQEVRESLVAGATFSEIQGTITAWSSTGVTLRAPDGLLDFASLERMRSSLRTEKAWGERMTAWKRQHVERLNQRQIASIQEWHARRMHEINMAGMAARHKIRMDTIAEIGRINSQIFANRSASSDRIQETFIDYVQEVQPWRDPSTGKQVDLSMHYSNAWQLSDGRQFLTNDPSFEPYRDLGIDGHRLQPVR